MSPDQVEATLSTQDYQPTFRTQLVRSACVAIAAILFGFGCYELFRHSDGRASFIILPTSFTFAFEAWTYTGVRSKTSRHFHSRFHSLAFITGIAAFVLILVAPADTDWNLGLKLGVISCMTAAHLFLFLAYFRQPYRPS